MTRAQTPREDHSKLLLRLGGACVAVGAAIFLAQIVRGDTVRWWNGLSLVAVSGALAVNWVQSARARGLLLLAMGLLSVIAVVWMVAAGTG